MGIESMPQQKNITQKSKLEKTLKLIDFDALKSTFENHALQSGANVDKMHFVQKENIKETKGLKHLLMAEGTYNTVDKNISIDEKAINIATKIQNLEKGSKLSLENAIFSAVCHEETHAVSFQEHIELTESLFGSSSERRIGYQTSKETKLGNISLAPNRAFVIFNEGITDKIGEEVYEMYHKNTETEALKKDEPYLAIYPVARTLVDTITKKISDECNIEKKEVWQGMVRGYYEGASFKDNEVIKRLFEDVVPNRFFETMAKTQSEFSPRILLLLAEIKLRHFPDKSRKKIRRFLKSSSPKNPD